MENNLNVYHNDSQDKIGLIQIASLLAHYSLYLQPRAIIKLGI